VYGRFLTELEKRRRRPLESAEPVPRGARYRADAADAR
jgi:hypothetical protein